MAVWCQVEPFSITVTFLAVNSFSYLSTLFSAIIGHLGGQIKQLKCSRASWLHLIITSAAAPVIHPSDTLQSARIAAVNQGKQTPPGLENSLLAVTNHSFPHSVHIPHPHQPQELREIIESCWQGETTLTGQGNCYPLTGEELWMEKAEMLPR